MATLERRGDAFRLIFYHEGQRHSQRIAAENEADALKIKERAERRLLQLGQGDELPEGADIGVWIVTDGRKKAEPKPADALPLGKLYDLYSKSLPAGSLEANTLLMIEIHLRHLTRILGDRTKLRSLTIDHCQRYVTSRLKEVNKRGKRQGKTVSPKTVKKEISTLAAMWNWAHARGKVTGMFPGRGLKYGKTEEQARFQTYDEIERAIKKGAGEELWECLYLTVEEIEQFLTHVKNDTYLYPALALAAYTSARRSEILRARPEDIDFEAKLVTIRERKRDKTKHTIRTVPMQPKLAAILQDWMTRREPCETLFCENGEAITADKFHWDFRQAVNGSKWEKMKGAHSLRHSFISACASKGVDPRIIDAFSGHTNEQTRKRYAHLYPSTQTEAIAKVFG